MGPKVQSVDQTNRATPLAEDFLKILQGQIDEGAFGTGVGPLQREAGTSAKQFVNSMQGAPDVNTAGKVGDYSKRLIDSTTELSNRQTNRGAADLREAFGAAGTRYGSSLATGEGRYRADANMDLGNIIAQILTSQGDREQSARQFDVNANQNKNAQFMNALSQLFGMGEANTAPFLGISQQGILNPETIVSDSLASTLLKGGLNTASSYLEGGGDVNPFNNNKNSDMGGSKGVNSKSVDIGKILTGFQKLKDFKNGGTSGQTNLISNPTRGPVYNPGATWDEILGGKRF